MVSHMSAKKQGKAIIVFPTFTHVTNVKKDEKVEEDKKEMAKIEKPKEQEAIQDLLQLSGSILAETLSVTNVQQVKSTQQELRQISKSSANEKQL